MKKQQKEAEDEYQRSLKDEAFDSDDDSVPVKKKKKIESFIKKQSSVESSKQEIEDNA